MRIGNLKLAPAGGGIPPVINYIAPSGGFGLGFFRWFRLALPPGVGPLRWALVARRFRFFPPLGHCAAVGFGRLRPRVNGFVSLSNFGPRSVLGFVAPRSVGFSLSRVGLVFDCALVSFYYSLHSESGVGVPWRIGVISHCIEFAFRYRTRVYRMWKLDERSS